MMTFNYLRRRVSIAHTHGDVTVTISHSNRRNMGVLGLLASTVAFFFAVAIFIAPFRRSGWSTIALYLLPLLALLLASYLIALGIFLWKAFGIEEISVRGGVMRWTCKALWLKDEFDIPMSDISEVRAVTPWHGRNRVEFTVQGSRYRLGEAILHDEATELVRDLKRAIGLR